MYDLIIQHGTVVTPDQVCRADLVISEGKIVGILQDSSALHARKIINAEGRYVLPGGVDPHVHTNLLLGEFTTLDSFVQCTVSAALGGNTTIVDFAIPQSKFVSPLQSFQDRLNEALDGAKIDVNLHVCLTRVDQETTAQIPELVNLGVRTFKMFTVYQDLVMLSYDEIWHALEAIAEVNGLAVIHAESNHIIEGTKEKLVAQGLTASKYHPVSRPTTAEVDAVQTVINMLRETHAAAYFVHISTPEALEVVTNARREGIQVWAETCPHYLVLDETLYGTENGHLYICSPPIRSRSQADELWRRTSAGEITIIGSDHCCYDTGQKLKYVDDFTRAPNGLPGVETRLPIMFSEGVMKGRLSLSQFATLTSTNPAKLNGLYPKKGVIQVGSDADIAIYDPRQSYIIGKETTHMQTDYSPFDGMYVQGRITDVIARGHVVVQDGTFIGHDHKGQFVPSSEIAI